MNIHSLELLILGLLLVVAVASSVARRFSVSYPIVLLIIGLLAGLIPAFPHVRLTPEIVFLVFLPPLLFAAAWQTSWREFKFNIVSISMLAVGLVFFTAFGVAFVIRLFLPAFDWKSGFVLGAVVSTTDAVAASSIARRLGLPGSVISTLEGESLVNDATGLLALSFAIDLSLHGVAPSIATEAGRFLWLLLGGAIIGLLSGLIGSFLERLGEDGPVAIALSVVVAYGAYFAGEVVHASGVTAVVTCGLYMSRQSSRFFSPVVRLQATAVWDTIEFVLNGLIFILIGLQLPYVLQGIAGLSPIRMICYGLIFSALLVVLRSVWMFPSSYLSYRIRRHLLGQQCAAPDTRTIILMGWVGMRGVVAIAAASSLPYSFPDGTPFAQRDMIIFLTFSVVVVTLVAQGLSLRPIIRLLGLRKDDGQNCEAAEARKLLIAKAIELLKTRRHIDDESHARAYDDAIIQYQQLSELIRDCGIYVPEVHGQAEFRQAMMLDAVRSEREELNILREGGRISDMIFRSIEHELDLHESKLLALR
jgi:Na+/H+ antiporter